MQSKQKKIITGFLSGEKCTLIQHILIGPWNGASDVWTEMIWASSKEQKQNFLLLTWNSLIATTMKNIIIWLNTIENQSIICTSILQYLYWGVRWWDLWFPPDAEDQRSPGEGAGHPCWTVPWPCWWLWWWYWWSRGRGWGGGEGLSGVTLSACSQGPWAAHQRSLQAPLHTQDPFTDFQLYTTPLWNPVNIGQIFLCNHTTKKRWVPRSWKYKDHYGLLIFILSRWRLNGLSLHKQRRQCRKYGASSRKILNGSRYLGLITDPQHKK